MKKNIFKIFFAFTLAEVLIVVGIIGIIAQMTIPTLLSNIQNEELHSQFKKTYSDLNQIAMQFKNDNGISVSEYTDYYYDWINFLDKEFWSYLKNKTYITKSSDLYLRALKGNVPCISICDNSHLHTEIGGRIYTFNEPNKPGENGPTVCVDINGYKKPNRYGQDFFLFVFTIDGRVIPMGMENEYNTTNAIDIGNNFYRSGNNYCQKDTNYVHQFACSYYALLNQHPTEAGKDYWHDFLGE